MKLLIRDTFVETSLGEICLPQAAKEAVQVDQVVVVLYDYMAFQQGAAARNVFAYDLDGRELWRAEDIGAGAADAYTKILYENPLVVGNFAGYVCRIDISNGKVVSLCFTK